MKKKSSLTKPKKNFTISPRKLATANRKVRFSQNNDKGGFVNAKRQKRFDAFDRQIKDSLREIDSSSGVLVSNSPRSLFSALNERLRLCSARQERRRAIIAIDSAKKRNGQSSGHRPPIWTNESRIQCR